jgi:hypothetical protein
MISIKMGLVNIFIISVFLSLFSCSSYQKQETTMDHVKTLDLSNYSLTSPGKPVHVLFIHHSTGGQLLAEKGTDAGQDCIYRTHPNGGGLRNLLKDNNYIVHEASYKSIVGDKTDICDWNAKFRDHMDQILTCKSQDEFFKDGTLNKIIIIKSCFPNNWIESDGKFPGNPDSCEKTLANTKAAYESLLTYFRSKPGTLFVVMTAPPLAEPVLSKKDRIIQFLKTTLGRPDTIDKIGSRARLFNNWLKDVENGWLKGYQLKNLVVFDYYDILTGQGKSNWTAYPTRGGADSHPSSEGNTIAAKEFIPFLNGSLNRMEMK